MSKAESPLVVDAAVKAQILEASGAEVNAGDTTKLLTEPADVVTGFLSTLESGENAVTNLTLLPLRRFEAPSCVITKESKSPCLTPDVEVIPFILNVAFVPEVVNSP